MTARFKYGGLPKQSTNSVLSPPKTAQHHLPSATATPSQPCAAGVFTAPILLPLVAHLLESFDALDKLVSFSSTNGRTFYKVEAQNLRSVTLRKEPFRIMESLSLKGDDVAPFWAGKELNWSIASEDPHT